MEFPKAPNFIGAIAKGEILSLRKEICLKREVYLKMLVVEFLNLKRGRCEVFEPLVRLEMNFGLMNNRELKETLIAEFLRGSEHPF